MYQTHTEKQISPNKLLSTSTRCSSRLDNKIVQLHTSADSRLKFAGKYLCKNLLLISIHNTAVIYRLNPPQASCTASPNETHWFGGDLKSPDISAMWKRTYGSLSSFPTFLNNLDRTLSILSPPRTQQLDCWGIQLLDPNGISIPSVLEIQEKTTCTLLL